MGIRREWYARYAVSMQPQCLIYSYVVANGVKPFPDLNHALLVKKQSASCKSSFVTKWAIA